jgi:adenylosuccinate lyase
MERRGGVPPGTAAANRAGAAALLPDRFPLERIAALERTLKHDLIAFLTAAGEVIGPAARHLHRGMTSSDVLDTALAVQLGEAGDLLVAALDAALEALEARARQHARTPCIGRTHGMHAEPTTFGLKLALAWDELYRGRRRLVEAVQGVRVGKLSGAVGTFAHLDPEVEAEVCAALGLRPAPVSSQVVSRDRHAWLFSAMALLATSIEKLAVEVRHLQRSEVGEATEAFTPGQKGSSAMPQKQNPILSENLSGLARLVRGYAQAALEDVVLWHERDISHSSVERVIGPDATIVLHFMLIRLRALVEGLEVHPERMAAHLAASGGAWAAQRAMLLLVEAGLSREEAYACVQAAALRTLHEGGRLADALRAAPGVVERLDADVLEGLDDPGWYTRHAEAILARVFAQKGA